MPPPSPPPAPGRPGAATAPATLEGVLDRVTFTNEENGWSVVRLLVPGQKDLVTAVGNLPGVQPGESLRLTGEWIRDRQYGEQFKVANFYTVKPATLVGIEKYLGSGLVRGVGKVMASRLVERFGLETLDVIEHQPERLVEVEGIGKVRSGRIRSAWEEQRDIREVMVFLQSNGVSTAFAVRIFKKYRQGAISVVKENPYRLAIDIFGIGFKTADKIAAHLGIPPDSPRRAEAAVLHMLGELSDEGHVYSVREKLVEATGALLTPSAPAEPAGPPEARANPVAPEIIEGAIEHMAHEEHLVIEPLAEGSSGIFLKSLHTAETGTAQLLRRLLASPLPPLAIDVDKAIGWFEQKQSISLAPEQQEALRQATRAKVLVITGGPGTGKTTLVNGIIQILEKKGRRILLAAPTGRAAKRMTETTGHEAKTLHRLLEFSPETNGFQRNQEQPLEADLLIVDETSMVDIVLAYGLLKAVPPSCQLILVGDVDQLPSVGPGSVLSDVIRSGAVPTVRLQHIFRQAQESLIVTNAHRVNRGELPVTRPGASDFVVVEREAPEEVLATVKHLVSERIPKGMGLHPIDDVQVLTPMHRGLLGAANLNSELQALLNPRGEAVTRGTRTFRVGDKVMQLRNNYELDVYNGDVGRVAAIDAVEQQAVVRFDGREVTYDFGELDELSLAYACSIHKSQGSEYPCVVIPLHTQHYVMLQRNLLYTAITRGKKQVILVGNRRALGLAVRNATLKSRSTRLAERLASA